jgi:hypothetical protein
MMIVCLLLTLTIVTLSNAQPSPSSTAAQCTGFFDGEPCTRPSGEPGACKATEACFFQPCPFNCTASTPLDSNCAGKQPYGVCLAASNKLGRCESVGGAAATCKALDENVRKCVNLVTSFPCDVTPAGSCQPQANASSWLECVANSDPIGLCRGKSKGDECTLYGGTQGHCIEGNRICLPQAACPQDRPTQCSGQVSGFVTSTSGSSGVGGSVSSITSTGGGGGIESSSERLLGASMAIAAIQVIFLL